MGGRRPSAAAPSFWGPLWAPEAPGPGGLGEIPPRKAGGSGGREPPRKSLIPICVGGRVFLAFPHMAFVGGSEASGTWKITWKSYFSPREHLTRAREI